MRLRAEEEINSHSQRELDLRISTLEACEPDAIFDSEIQHIVQKALKRMPNQSRQIFILSRYHDMKYEEIASQMNISVNTVKYHIKNALSKLRTELKDYLVVLLLFLLSNGLYYNTIKKLLDFLNT